MSPRMKVRLIQAVNLGVNTILAIGRKVLWPGRQPENIRRVCIYRIGHIGDIVCALPAMQAIRQAYPQASLTLLTSPGTPGMPSAADVLGGAPWLDHLLIYYQQDLKTLESVVGLIRKLRAEKFDIWIELPNGEATVKELLRNMAFARMAGAGWGEGWRLNTIRWNPRLQSDHLEFSNEVERLLSIVRETGVDTSEIAFPLPVTEAHAETVESIWKQHGLDVSRLVAMAPGAKRSTNRWPADRFVEVGRYLVRSHYQIVLIGGESDKDLCQWVMDEIGHGCTNLAGRTSLLESCQVLKQTKLLICNDSGVQHLAAAVGTPCISIFSARDFKGRWYPFGNQHQVLRKSVTCHPCFLETCPWDNLCLRLIEPTEVIEAIERQCAQSDHKVPFGQQRHVSLMAE